MRSSRCPHANPDRPCTYADMTFLLREYLPELIPVEVPERKAKEWFHSLLSGVQFLHSRGVVHNDIK
jgi:serine/threonine protein kinase